MARLVTEAGQKASDGGMDKEAVMAGRPTTTSPLAALVVKLIPESCTVTKTVFRFDGGGSSSSSVLDVASGEPIRVSGMSCWLWLTEAGSVTVCVLTLILLYE